jgi:hypothetical protein
MKAYLVTISQSDGNDNTIYEAVIEADSSDSAIDIIRAQVESDNDGEWEGTDPDGYRVEDNGCNEGKCETCSHSDSCDGPCYIITSIDEVEEHVNKDAAEAARAYYHSRWN